RLPGPARPSVRAALRSKSSPESSKSRLRLIEKMKARTIERQLHHVSRAQRNVALHAHQQRLSAVDHVQVGLRAEPLHNRDLAGQIRRTTRIDQTNVLG